jgi:hypothetical protein
MCWLAAVQRHAHMHMLPMSRSQLCAGREQIDSLQEGDQRDIETSAQHSFRPSRRARVVAVMAAMHLLIRGAAAAASWTRRTSEADAACSVSMSNARRARSAPSYA